MSAITSELARLSGPLAYLVVAVRRHRRAPALAENNDRRAGP